MTKVSKMTADEMRAKFAKEYGVSQKEAKEQLNGIFEFFEDILVNDGKSFTFGNLGVMELFVKPERAYRNPQTGEMGEVVPAHYDVKLKPSKGDTSTRAKLKELEV